MVVISRRGTCFAKHSFAECRRREPSGRQTSGWADTCVVCRAPCLLLAASVPNPQIRPLLTPGRWASACLMVQCARLFWRRPRGKPMMGPVLTTGMEPLSRSRARCRSQGSRVVRCRGRWRRRPRSLCSLILLGAVAKLAVRSVGAHWFARLCLAMVVTFGPTERVGHPRDTLVGLVLWLAGLLRPSSLRYVVGWIEDLPRLACSCERSLRGTLSPA